jgi:pimeloyl-ACP methyl ester carboxylesterase
LEARFLLALCLCQVTLGVQGQVFDVPHLQDAPTRTLFVGVQNPKALVLLFPGGGGLLHLKDDGSTRNQHTFIRSLDQWAQYQIDATLVDTPYDLGDLRRGDRRNEEDHLKRVGEVVDFYKTKTGLPIWIFGHSMGTSTATYFVNQLNEDSKKLSGIVIAGTVRTASINDEVSLPVEAIHHLQDQCGGTPLSASKDIVTGRPKNYISQLEIVEGGITEGNVCDSFGYHGFNQTEPELVKRAAQFILTQK